MAAPRVTLKLATSLDGRIATAAGESRWITGEAARLEVHRLRAAHDAVLVGSQTVLDDDPELTVRLAGYDGPQPLRAVADARLRTPLTSRLVRSASAGQPLLILTARLHEQRAARPHVELREVDADKSGRLNVEGLLVAVAEALWALARVGGDASARVLVEGGGELTASFVNAGLVDRVEWFRAPVVLGAQGRPAVGALTFAALAEAPRFKRVELREVGEDAWESYERA